MNRRDIEAVEPAPEWAVSRSLRKRLLFFGSAVAVFLLLAAVTVGSAVAIVVTVLRWMGVV